MSLDKYQLQWIIWELVLHFIWGTLDWHNTSKQCWEPDHRDQKARKFVILGVGRPPSVPFWFVPQENEFHSQAGLASQYSLKLAWVMPQIYTLHIICMIDTPCIWFLLPSAQFLSLLVSQVKIQKAYVHSKRKTRLSKTRHFDSTSKDAWYLMVR